MKAAGNEPTIPSTMNYKRSKGEGTPPKKEKKKKKEKMEKETIGEMIKTIRKSQGITQRELARDTRLSLRMIRRVEQENHIPYLGTLYRLCDGLGIDMYEILAIIDFPDLPHKRRKKNSEK